MSMERLSQQIDAYIAWKREIIREIIRYRSWLAHNRLGSEAMDSRLERTLRLLRTDHITLAFIGEFSRGKTELINSLFFSEYGQRVLPSQAGRTTMCPTELLFDPCSEHSYIRLLPIETRMTDTSVAQFKRIPHHWVNIPLDSSAPDSMALAFAQVSKTKPMQVEQAIQLGFLPEMLESVGKSGQVLVPAWRHAIVNLDHPLLRQGLCILDTPGLNALGSEPELTLSLLPSAQAILFLLSADTGVTASDLAVWQDHIRKLNEDTQATLFAVLNKIDVLWDDLAGEEHVQKSIAQIQSTTARQLGIPTRNVLPLSAKQAVIAKSRKDEQRLAHSQLASLENLLCEHIVAQKERLLEDRVVHQVLVLLNNSQQVLNLRLGKVREQQQLLSAHQYDNGQLLLELTTKAKEDHSQHHKRLLDLKSNQCLLKRQGDLLQAAVHPQRLEQHLTQVRQELAGSWMTLGINQAIVQFFRNVDHDLSNLAQEAVTANKMVSAIYRRHNEENPLYSIDAPLFNYQRYQDELAHLHGKAHQFRRHLRTLLTEQHSLTRRFFTTLVQEVIGLHQGLRNDTAQWANDALMPLMQHMLEHKQLLENHMLRLKALAQDTQQTRQRDQQLVSYAVQLETQLDQVSEMLRVLRRPSPIQRQSKVINLPTVLHG